MVESQERSFARYRGLGMTMTNMTAKKDGALKGAATKSKSGRSVA